MLPMIIIYEDKNILAVNKPAGLLVHPVQAENSKPQTLNSKKTTDSLTNWLIQNYPNIRQVGDNPKTRPGIVHRLDKETSGILLVAKNQNAFEYLKSQFKERKIKKTYLTLVKGVVKNSRGRIDTPIKRFSKSREATTKYEVIKKYKDYTFLRMSPKTGRTHQIRIHLKSIGHPIVCDKIYTKKPNCPFGLKRHFLHASSLELTLPNKTRIKIEAEMPKDLQDALKNLGNYDKQDR